MYTQVLFFALPAAVLAYIASSILSLRRNITTAKQSGLPYVVVPVHMLSAAWLLGQVIVLPLLKKLPDSWTDWWLPISLPQGVWHQGFDPFAKVGSETFLAVSAGGIIMWTCEPEAITEIEHRRHDFVKPKDMMAILNVFGPTLTASNGEEARIYRKMASVSFNETTMKSAWQLTLNETSQMINKWIPAQASSGVVPRINTDTARLALHILSAGMYGKTMDWEDVEGHVGKVPPGHELSFEEAIAQCLENTPTIFFIPLPVLKISTLESHKKAYQTYREWYKYMEELRDEKLNEIATHGKSPHPNLMDAIVYAGIDPKDRPEKDSKDPHISPQAVLGNMFIFFLGGHETTANTMTFLTVALACLPDIQKRLQSSLDDQFGDRPTTEWSYDKDLPALLSGYTGAFMNEVLRLYSILPFIPKGTEKEAKQITLSGRSCVVPPNTTILINTSATHRNPKYWSTPRSSKLSGETKPYPLSSFNPEQWLDSTTSSHPTGAFIPFSEGFRSCIGQRFAKVEVAGAIARIFKEYTVELEVEGSENMDQSTRSAAWKEARANAEDALSAGIDMQMSLKMVKDVKLRFSRRGQERFYNVD